MEDVRLFAIVHFTVTGENEAGVDLVLIQPFLLYYVNHVILIVMLTRIWRTGRHTPTKNSQEYPPGENRELPKLGMIKATFFS